jgi:hypothetical protein
MQGGVGVQKQTKEKKITVIITQGRDETHKASPSVKI